MYADLRHKKLMEYTMARYGAEEGYGHPLQFPPLSSRILKVQPSWLGAGEPAPSAKPQWQMQSLSTVPGVRLPCDHAGSTPYIIIYNIAVLVVSNSYPWLSAALLKSACNAFCFSGFLGVCFECFCGCPQTTN